MRLGKSISGIRGFAATALLAALGAATSAAGAATIDLTHRGSSGAINGALFYQCDPQPTGTGAIQPIVRLQGNCTEQGYNTDARPVEFNELTDPNFTRSIQLKDVGSVTLTGTTYRKFLLDINEPCGPCQSSLILDRLQIFMSTNPAVSKLSTLSHPVYDLGCNRVVLDAALSCGSGSGDMFAYVPERCFDGAPSDNYLYLYSHFTKSGGGFEEWSVVQGSAAPSAVPEPSSALLALVGLGVSALRRPNRHK